MNLTNSVVVADETSRDAGFVAPVVIARDVWDDCVHWPDTPRPESGRCVTDRLNILLSVAWEVVHRAGGLNGGFAPTEFAVRRFPVDGPLTLERVGLLATLTDEGVVITRATGGRR